MIHSMTAFARRQLSFDSGQIGWEIKSVNSRYLDINFLLPESLHSIELALLARAKKRLHRGRINAKLSFFSDNMQPNLLIDHGLLKALLQASEEINNACPNLAKAKVTDFLSWPSLLQLTPIELSTVTEEIDDLFCQTIDDLVMMRQREGGKIADFLQARLEKIKENTAIIYQLSPNIIMEYEKKLRAKLQQLNLRLDDSRLEQEMIFYCQKIDITEELDRLQMHITEMERILTQGGVMGRRVDFLLQEFNREANTLASKSGATAIAHHAIDIKVWVEQMREQVQNIE